MARNYIKKTIKKTGFLSPNWLPAFIEQWNTKKSMKANTEFEIGWCKKQQENLLNVELNRKQSWKKYQQCLIEAVDNAGRNVRYECLLKFCEQALIKGFCTDEKSLSFVGKTTVPMHRKLIQKVGWVKWRNGRERWCFERGLLIQDGTPQTENSFYSSKKAAPNANSTRQTSRTSIFWTSETSTEKQRELRLANHWHKEIQQRN